MADQATAAPSATDPRRSPSPPERMRSSAAEDPDTAAARREFDNTQISEKPDPAANPMTAAAQSAPALAPEARKRKTPELEVPHDSMKDQISSPKKKRAHDELDQNKDTAQDPNGDVSPIGANGSATLSRTDRSEPEKKRPRDISSELKANQPQDSTNSTSAASSSAPGEKQSETPSAAGAADTSATSTSAFKSSGLAGFATSSSPFLQSGTKPLSSFASASGSASPFGAAAAAAAPSSETPSLFGGSSLSNGSSPFGQIGGASKPFGGSVFGSGFSSGLAGGKLTSFAKPGETLKSSKPARAFGAPESDPESEDEDDADDGEKGDGEKQEKEERDGESDRKKIKLPEVVIENGEAGETTVLQVRAKIFHLDKSVTPVAWKERGAGNLKINVPEQCIDFDDNHAVIPGSFDASSIRDGEVKIVRLVMRQDSTHRVILNTAVIPAMKFQERPMNKAVCVLFTAIEGTGEPASIQLKMNPANAKSFLNEVEKIQRELQSS